MKREEGMRKEEGETEEEMRRVEEERRSKSWKRRREDGEGHGGGQRAWRRFKGNRRRRTMKREEKE